MKYATRWFRRTLNAISEEILDDVFSKPAQRTNTVDRGVEISDATDGVNLSFQHPAQL